MAGSKGVLAWFCTGAAATAAAAGCGAALGSVAEAATTEVARSAGFLWVISDFSTLRKPAGHTAPAAPGILGSERMKE